MKFGDIASRVATYINLDMETTIREFSRQTEDHRTLSFREFLNRSKVLLLQLLIISRWIGSNEVQQYTNRMQLLLQCVNTSELFLNSDLDRMFYLHGGLYPMRSSIYDIPTSQYIMIHGIYPHLPGAMFLKEKNETNLITLKSELTKSDLDLFIRSKLALGRDMLNRGDSIIVNGGILKIVKTNLFELHLTLASLDEESAWLIIDFWFSVSHHPIEQIAFYNTEMNVSKVQSKVLEVLHAITSHDVSCDTHRILDICSHSALAVVQQYLYLQAVEQCKLNLGNGCHFASFQNTPGSLPTISVEFWRNKHPSISHFELRIVHDGLHLNVEVFICEGSSEDIQKSNISEWLASINVFSYIKDGVSFQALFADVLNLCSKGRLLSLYNRLLTHNFGTDIINIEMIENSCHILISKSAEQVYICIDANTGECVVLEHVDPECLLGIAIDNFIAEVNDLTSWGILKLVLERRDVGLPPITTSIKLIRVLALHHWTTLFSMYSRLPISLCNDTKSKMVAKQLGTEPAPSAVFAVLGDKRVYAVLTVTSTFKVELWKASESSFDHTESVTAEKPCIIGTLHPGDSQLDAACNLLLIENVSRMF